ncbi:hypothetical protein RND81_08G022700 [Saponaria officinalis]|uniref:PRA1 family protein n=1 Tax=Saponaria officinalis TaxID=3572 RepID=A0AAW1J2Y9_SAPOF
MTTYGTIPTTTTAVTTQPHDLISGATDQIQSQLSTLRPWSEFLSFTTLSIPPSFSVATSRATANLPYFRTNYTILILVSLFLSLITHPISLLFFFLLFGAWLLLYFLRHAPLIILARVMDDNVVLLVLGVSTVVFLLLTDVTVNIVVAVTVGVAVALVHAAIREVDDLRVAGAEFEDERVGFSRGGGERLPLKDTASSAFSS